MTKTKDTRAYYFLGLDLGPPADRSALAVLERQGPPVAECVYHCRHLRRWPVRTPYSSILADVCETVRSPELKGGPTPALVLDSTATGPPVVNLFRKELVRPAPVSLWSEGEPLARRHDVNLVTLEMTGGSGVTWDAGVVRVPKRDLISVAQVALQAGRLKVAASLAEAATLTRELENFKVRVTLAGEVEEPGEWREGAHDDLVFAVCLALWEAERAVERAINAALVEELPGTVSFYDFRW